MLIETTHIPHALRSPNYRRLDAEIRHHQHLISILRSRMADAQNAPPLNRLWGVLLRVTGFRARELRTAGRDGIRGDVCSIFAYLARCYGYSLRETAAYLQASEGDVDALLRQHADRLFEPRFRATSQGICSGVRHHLRAGGQTAAE